MKKRILQIFIILVGIGLIIKFTGDILKLFKAGEQIKLAQQRVSQLEKEKEELVKKQQYYQSEDFIEEEARNKLNMAKPGETIVILPPNLGQLMRPSQKESSPSVPNWKKWWNLFF